MNPFTEHRTDEPPSERIYSDSIWKRIHGVKNNTCRVRISKTIPMKVLAPLQAAPSSKVQRWRLHLVDSREYGTWKAAHMKALWRLKKWR